jgi:hypothetical protein
MPDDLHSTYIQTPLLNLHMYGPAIDQLRSREYYDKEKGKWLAYPSHSDIREARW